jgi:5-methylcytosine-specific restriction endonuclease McrA
MTEAEGHLVNLVGEVTGGDASAMERLTQKAEEPGGNLSSKDIRSAFRSHGLPWAQIVDEDVNRILSGRQPKYFAPHQQLAERYRQHHSVRIKSVSKEGLRHISEGAEAARRDLDELQEYGISLMDYRNGVACRREQKMFYQTLEWQGRAKVRRAMDRFACTGCGTKNVELHVHHNEPIFSAYSRKFDHNFDLIRMRTLCVQCHSEFHDERIRTSYGFEIAKGKEKRAENDRMNQLMQLHDEVGQCPYCCNHVWQTEANADYNFDFIKAV